MKCAIRAVALTAALFGAGSVTQAGMIVGSQGVAVVLSPISANTGNNIATADLFSGLTFTTTASQTGDFTGLAAGQNLSNIALDLNNIAAFTFGNLTFGTFQATSFTDTGFDNVNKSRGFLIVGAFTPGTGLPTFTGNSALLSISFTQVGGPTSSISLSGTLTTPAPSSTPEPSTIVMLATIAGPIGFGAWRRRKTKVSA
jgi:hypothetical protein